MQFSVFGLWQCCVIDSRVTCAVLMGWGQNLRLDLLTSFTLSALSAETNIVHHFLFLADTQMDGWCRAWRRMIEWVRESKSLVFCALTPTDGKRRETKDGWKESRQSKGKSWGMRKGRHLDLNADMHARVREQEEVRRCRKGGRDGRRAPGRGCRQTGRVTRGRRWPSLLLEDRRLYLKAWSMLGAAEVSASQPGNSSPL